MFIVGAILLAGALFFIGRMEGFRDGFLAGHEQGWCERDCLTGEELAELDQYREGLSR